MPSLDTPGSKLYPTTQLKLFVAYYPISYPLLRLALPLRKHSESPSITTLAPPHIIVDNVRRHQLLSQTRTGRDWVVPYIQDDERVFNLRTTIVHFWKHSISTHSYMSKSPTASSALTGKHSHRSCLRANLVTGLVVVVRPVKLLRNVAKAASTVAERGGAPHSRNHH